MTATLTPFSGVMSSCGTASSGGLRKRVSPHQMDKCRWRLTLVAQPSEELLASSADSAASFNRSALLMYLDLFAGASLALAFLAWAFNNCCIFLRRFILCYPAGQCFNDTRLN